MLTPGLTNVPSEAHSLVYLTISVRLFKTLLQQLYNVLHNNRNEFSPKSHRILVEYTAKVHYYHPLFILCMCVDSWKRRPFNFYAKCGITDRLTTLFNFRRELQGLNETVYCTRLRGGKHFVRQLVPGRVLNLHVAVGNFGQCHLETGLKQ
jgi:hypothetical protein